LKNKFEEVKAAVIEKAMIVKEKLIKAEHEAQQKLEGLKIVVEKILKEKVAPAVEKEVNALVAIAEVKLQEAEDMSKVIAEKIEDKIESILELINDKTHGAADEQIKKLEAKLEALIAIAEDQVSSLGEKAKSVMEKLKSDIDDLINKLVGDERGMGSDALCDKIMELINKPISKLPESIQHAVSSTIEHALRFGVKFGKTLLMKLLDLVGDKFGDEAKGIVEMVKMALSMAYKRGASTEVAVKEVMAALEKPLASLPENISEWVKEMIEAVIRFALGHGKKGINHLLDMIVDKAGDDVKPVIEAVKDILDQVVYGATTEVTVTEIMNLLDNALEKVPEGIREWVKEMIEQVIRFSLGHGVKGIHHLLDIVAEKSGNDDVKNVIEAAKDAIEKII